jgi:hypothetical protein
MFFELTWNNKTQQIELPAELTGLSERARWTWVQATVCGLTDATERALTVDCPGLTYGESRVVPFSFSAACDTFSPAGHSNTRSQMSKLPVSARHTMDVESGSRGHDKRILPSSTSISALELAPHRVVEARATKHGARAHTGAPMGARPTKHAMQKSVRRA